MNYNSEYIHRERKDASYYIRHFSRVFIGVLFIFSAYVKGVDPFGFALKIEEYFVSFGMDFMIPFSMLISCFMLLVEFILGVSMLFNIQLRFFSWILLLFMIFFTCLTFYLAFALSIVEWINRVAGTTYQVFVPADCGCFGDFVKLTNIQTFLKNVVFMIPTLIIFCQRKKFKVRNFRYITEWFPLLVGTCFILFMEIHCLRHEPWHDFRPWNKGHFIAAETYSAAPQMDYVFRYKHNANGSMKEITMDELMTISEDSSQNADLEANYTYVDRVEKVIKPGIDAKLADFTMLDPETREDIKSDIIEYPDYAFILFYRDVNKVKANSLDEIKTFYDSCVANEIPFVAVTASFPLEVKNLKSTNKVPYKFYYSDATPMKTALRNNLGLLLVKEGYVIDKWSFRDIPTFEKFTGSIEQYEKNINRYRLKNPPVLPDGSILKFSQTIEK